MIFIFLEGERQVEENGAAEVEPAHSQPEVSPEGTLISNHTGLQVLFSVRYSLHNHSCLRSGRKKVFERTKGTGYGCQHGR